MGSTSLIEPEQTLRYHLAVLEKEQQIVSHRAGHIYHYFPNGSSLSYADTIRITLCQNPTTEKILGIIAAEPGISGTVLPPRCSCFGYGDRVCGSDAGFGTGSVCGSC
ncbi:hypothetical protein [Methanocorpusculum petauri]|uniref:hypothetical protein n=1 Tax=Methanocorpusculum petauri TaxID=3002863 RepID=UPI0030B9F7E1